MRFNTRVVSALAFSCILSVAFSQRTNAQDLPNRPGPEFEVASVKPAGPVVPGQVQIGIHIDGAQFTASYMSMKDLIRMAYQIKDYQIAGPEWMAGERFTLTAKIPAGSNQKDLPAMMRALLAERFHVKIHTEKRDFPVYGLVALKGGVKLKESALDPIEAEAVGKPANVNVTAGGSASGTMVNLGRGASFSMSGDKIEARKMTLAQMSELLARFVDRPVVDMTETAGTFDLILALTPEDFRAMQIRAAIVAGVQLPPQVMAMADSASGDSLHSGLAAGGLKLEPKKAPLDFFVVDSADKTPSAN